MTYIQRTELLKKLCAPCPKKETCHFGCEAWQKEINKIAAELKHLLEDNV